MYMDGLLFFESHDFLDIASLLTQLEQGSLAQSHQNAYGCLFRRKRPFYNLNNSKKRKNLLNAKMAVLKICSRN